MKANIIQIGNSKGVRIPKVLLEQARLGKEVELEVVDRKIVIHPSSGSRQGWDRKFSVMAGMKEEDLIREDLWIENRFDRDEWEW
ncbi:MAG: AbrB/MazE/SpoVT family DNA-binding domain-containing protein [Thermodesulfobacteriota bacterium]